MNNSPMKVKAMSHITEPADIVAFLGESAADGVSKITLVDSGAGIGFYTSYPAWITTVNGRTINHGATFGYFVDGAWRLTVNESFAMHHAATMPQVGSLNA